MPEDQEPNLEAELARDAQFVEALQDERFASAVYMVFVNRLFLKGKKEEPWQAGDRSVAHFIAKLRDLGESYHDFYLGYDFDGVWPDDRPAKEAEIRKRIADLSQPVEFHFNAPLPCVVSGKSGPRRIDTQEKWEKLRAERLRNFESKRPELEAKRQADLQEWQHRLARLHENRNDDVLQALRGHLSRLGWRTQTEADRLKPLEAELKVRIEVLREIRAYEARPEVAPEPWAVAAGNEPLRRVYDRLYRYDLELKTAEECEAHSPAALRERLAALAASGRISKREFERLSTLIEDHRELRRALVPIISSPT